MKTPQFKKPVDEFRKLLKSVDSFTQGSYVERMPRSPTWRQKDVSVHAKITQQISKRPPANKALRPLYRVFVNWFDLDEE